MLLQLIVLGIAIGGIYGLIGMGFNMTFWTLRIVSFAQGDILMIIVMLSLGFAGLVNSLLLGIIMALFLGVILAIFLERATISPLLKHPHNISWIIATLGAGITLRNIANLLWGSSEYAFPSPFGNASFFSLGGVTLSYQIILVFVATLVIVGFFEFLTENTLYGKAMKATALDSEAAEAMGINTRGMVSISFALSAIFAGLAGILVAPLTSASAFMGISIGVKGFAAAVIGGMGRPKGALVGGMIIGLCEQLGSGFISPAIKDAIGLVPLFIVLLILPNGLFGTRHEMKV